jgi:hypothetical protein
LWGPFTNSPHPAALGNGHRFLEFFMIEINFYLVVPGRPWCILGDITCLRIIFPFINNWLCYWVLSFLCIYHEYTFCTYNFQQFLFFIIFPWFCIYLKSFTEMYFMSFYTYEYMCVTFCRLFSKLKSIHCNACIIEKHV